jgi:hypothetical protein
MRTNLSSRFVWLTLITFTVCSMPHADLLISSAGSLVVSEAYAADVEVQPATTDVQAPSAEVAVDTGGEVANTDGQAVATEAQATTASTTPYYLPAAVTFDTEQLDSFPKTDTALHTGAAT